METLINLGILAFLIKISFDSGTYKTKAENLSKDITCMQQNQDKIKDKIDTISTEITTIKTHLNIP